ncbi:MAG TPA: RNA polymerase sigma-70 factor [Puia sp.]|nr:RNA polymerase sigma-70 factor [Puia sp.]
MEQPDNDLILQFNQGDIQAFSVIYDTHYVSIYRFVRQFIHEREEAEDIVANTFIKLWKLRSNFESRHNIKAFLYITTRNACFDSLRHQKRQSEKQKELFYFLSQRPAEEHFQDDVETEVLKSIFREIEKLPPSVRTVFKMAYIEGKSNDEIAAHLHITNQSVRNNKHRAIKLLRMAILNTNMDL